MHGPMSIGMFLLVGGVAMAGVATGFYLPVPQADEEAIAAAAQFADPEINRLHEGCMTGPLMRGVYPDSVQKQYCDCHAEEALDSLTSRQIDLLTTVFEEDPAALKNEIDALSQSEAAELSKRMSAIYKVEQRCRKRLYEVALEHPSTQNEDSIRNNPRFTAFYDGCVLGYNSHEKSPLDVQRAFCECYGREAAIHLQATEIQALTVGFHQGLDALKEHIEALPRAERVGFAKRIDRFNETAPQKCLNAGSEAAGTN